MIKNYDDYKEYIKLDRIANKKKFKSLNIFHYLGFGEAILVFLVLLRKVEYIKNSKKGFLWKFYYKFLYLIFVRHSMKLGFSIPLNVLGAGVSIPHRGTIVINNNVEIGRNCRIHVCVNIGAHKGLAPKIGNNVYIGPGAKIFGDITIANSIAIGANAVVNKSFNEECITIGGIPARKISNMSSEELIPNYEK